MGVWRLNNNLIYLRRSVFYVIRIFSSLIDDSLHCSIATRTQLSSNRVKDSIKGEFVAASEPMKFS